MHGLKPNWPAIFMTILGLIVIGWLLGRLVTAPDGESLRCPEEDWVQIIPSADLTDHHVLVYCEPPATN